jgi:hypothetical protein
MSRQGLADIPALAQAMATQQIHPGYVEGLSFQESIPGAGGGVYPHPIDGRTFALDDATSQQIASLLGGSVSKQPCVRGVTNVTPVPDCNFITYQGNTVPAVALAAISNPGPDVNSAIAAIDNVFGQTCRTDIMPGALNFYGYSQNPNCTQQIADSVTPKINDPSLTQLQQQGFVSPASNPPAAQQPVITPGQKTASVIINSSGATSSTGSTAAPSSFDFSSIPWWVWLAGAGAIWYATKGN